MKIKIVLSMIIVTIFSININANITLNEELNYIGKSLFTQAGFYSTCGNKKIVTKNQHALKWTQFQASKYLLFVRVGSIDKKMSKLINNSQDFKNDFINEVKTSHDIAKFEKLQRQWFMDGTHGIVVSDPKVSDDTFKLEFNKKNCNIVKKILDTNYQIMYDSVMK